MLRRITSKKIENVTYIPLLRAGMNKNILASACIKLKIYVVCDYFLLEYWIHNKQLACGIIVLKCQDSINDKVENDTINRSDTDCVINIQI
jgi:hypothetical protein